MRPPGLLEGIHSRGCGNSVDNAMSMSERLVECYWIGTVKSPQKRNQTTSTSCCWETQSISMRFLTVFHQPLNIEGRQLAQSSARMSAGLVLRQGGHDLESLCKHARSRLVGIRAETYIYIYIYTCIYVFT